MGRGWARSASGLTMCYHKLCGRVLFFEYSCARLHEHRHRFNLLLELCFVSFARIQSASYLFNVNVSAQLQTDTVSIGQLAFVQIIFIQNSAQNLKQLCWATQSQLNTFSERFRGNHHISAIKKMSEQFTLEFIYFLVELRVLLQLRGLLRQALCLQTVCLALVAVSGQHVFDQQVVWFHDWFFVVGLLFDPLLFD